MTSFGRGQRTLTVVKKIASHGLRVLLVFFLLESNSNAQGETAKRSTPPPNNISKLNQKLQKPESDFSVSGSLLQSKPVRDELNQMTLISAGLDYRLENSLSHQTKIGVGLDYAYIWSQYKEESQSQLDGAALSLSRSSEISRTLSFDYGLDLGIPANNSDTTAGFNGSAGFPLGIAWNFSSQTLALGLAPTFYSYRYKTSTENGDEYNKKISGLASLGLLSRLSSRFAWSNGVKLFEYQNYAGNSYQIYSLSSYLKFKAWNQLTFIAGVTSRDRVITTNSVLADDITSYRAGMEWSY